MKFPRITNKYGLVFSILYMHVWPWNNVIFKVINIARFGFSPLLVFWFFSPFWFFGFCFFSGVGFFSGDFVFFQGFFSGVLVFWAIYIIIWTLPPKADILDTHTRHPMKTGRRCQWKEFLPISIAPWEVIQHHRYTTNFCVILDLTYIDYIWIYSPIKHNTKAHTD